MLEIIAMTSMLIDHLGRIYFPTHHLFYIIGRLALPLYTYKIVQGFSFTRNLKRYLARLVILALASQFFFFQLFKDRQLNIIFTYVFILCFLAFIKKYNPNIAIKIFMISVFGIFLTILQLEAGFYVLILSFIYYYKNNLFLKHGLLNIFTALFFNNIQAALQVFSLIGTLLVILLPNRRLKGRLRIGYRIFYPFHLSILWAIKTIVR